VDQHRPSGFIAGNHNEASMTAPQQPALPSFSISQYWNTEPPPEYMDGLFASFRDLNPEFSHRVFSEAQTERFVAERFGAREAAAFRACAVPSMQSDYFRYCAVLALGGVYADADFRCIRSLRPLVDRPDAGEIFLSPSLHTHNGITTRRVWSQFFAFREPGHPFLRLALELATVNMEERVSEKVWPVGEKVIESIWLTVGPGIFTMMMYMRDLGSFDAFREAVAGSDAEPFSALYCEVVDDYDRIPEAFEGVRVSSHEEMIHWIRDPEEQLDYKQTDAHWHNVRTEIFR
jgi:hypothetical protein